MSMVAAAAATAACPGRIWGHPEGVPARVAPSPPRHFTFETPPVPSEPCRPRRRQRRVLYPPAVRRPLPSESPGAAQRLLLLLLAVVGAQIYATPCDVIADVITDVTATPCDVIAATVTSSPSGNSGSAGIPNVTTPMGGACPVVVAPPGGVRTR